MPVGSAFRTFPPERLADVLARLKPAGTTVLLCTARPGSIVLDGWLWLGRAEQRRFGSREELNAFVAEREAAYALPA